MKILDFYRQSSLAVGIAKIIFDDLYKKYPIKTIKEVAKTTSGSTPNRGYPNYFNGNIPWLKSGELNDGIINTIQETITEEGLKNSSAKLLPEGTLVVAMYGATAGKCGILGIESTTNQAVCAIFPSGNILSEYLYWFFRQQRLNYLQISKGGAQPNISQTVIKKTSLPVPPQDIQEKIINYLSEIENNNLILPDFHVDGLKKKLSKYFAIYNFDKKVNSITKHQQTYIQKLRQQILQEAIQGKLTEEWRRQNPDVEPASELLKRIKAEKERLVKEGKIKKQKPLPPIKEEEKPFELPEGWVWCRLGEIIIYTENDNIHNNYIDNQLINYVDIDAIDNDNFIIKNIKKKRVKDLSTRARRVLKKDYIIYSLVRPYLNNIAIIKQKKDYFIGSTGFVVFKPIYTEKQYIFYLLLSKYIHDYYLELLKGFNSPRVKNEEFQLTPISIPPLNEQQIIIQKINKLINNIDHLSKQISKNGQYADKLMQAVLREAFEGGQ